MAKTSMSGKKGGGGCAIAAIVVVLLTIFLVSATWSQWLPVYSHGIGWKAPMPEIESPFDGDTLDGKYAVMKYGEHPWGARATSVLKYHALDTIQVWDHYTLYIHGRIPENADLVATMMTDSTNWSVLYTTLVTRLDNTPEKPRDTVLTLDVPQYSIFHYGQPFWRFALIRDYRNLRFASRDDIYIDGIFLVVHPPDTIINPRDTIQDTTHAFVSELLPKPVSVWKFFNILGYPVMDTASCRACIAIDQFGRKRLIRK